MLLSGGSPQIDEGCHKGGWVRGKVGMVEKLS
jgi:hypothetical protein